MSYNPYNQGHSNNQCHPKKTCKEEIILVPFNLINNCVVRADYIYIHPRCNPCGNLGTIGLCPEDIERIEVFVSYCFSGDCPASTLLGINDNLIPLQQICCSPIYLVPYAVTCNNTYCPGNGFYKKLPYHYIYCNGVYHKVNNVFCEAAQSFKGPRPNCQ